VQIFVGLRANSRAICRKHTGIWTDQTVSQQVLLLSDSLLVTLKSEMILWLKKGKILLDRVFLGKGRP
jgi:hypothetical protein